MKQKNMSRLLQALLLIAGLLDAAVLREENDMTI